MADFDLEDIKLIIKSIVISSKESIAINTLRQDFKASEGYDIPFPKMGYSNLLDFLHSLKDTLVVLPDQTVKAVQCSKQQHLLNMIEKQKSSQVSRKRKGRSSRLKRKSYNYSQTQYNTQRYNRPRQQSGAFSRARYSGSNTSNHCGRQTQSRFNQYSYRNHVPERRLVPDRYAFSSSSSSSEQSFEVVNGHITEDEKESVEPSIVAVQVEPEVCVTRVDFSSALTPQLKNNLRGIIREHPEGIRCSELSQLVREKYGAPLNYRKYGFTSMLQLVDCIPEIFKYEDQENDDWLLLDAENTASNTPTKIKEAVSVKVCEKIFEVAKTLNYPMSTNQFNKRYENMFRKSLSEEVEGITNIDSILLSIDKKFVRLEKVGNEYYVMPFKKICPNALDVGCDDGEIDYPSHMLPLGGEVPPLEPFSDAITPTMKVCVGEIYNPHKFFMLSSYLKNSYDHLHKHIQLFYSKSENLSLADQPVKKGLYCVAPYLDKWHRAVILSVRNPNEVIVFLIDYGTYLKVACGDLRFLHEDFASIPRLALRAILEDIKPLGTDEKFSMEANRLFLDLTANKDLIAYVKKVDFTQQKYLVQLAERERDREVFINERLVSAGVAEFGQHPGGAEESIAETSSEPSSGEIEVQRPQMSRKSTGDLLKSLLNRSR